MEQQQSKNILHSMEESFGKSSNIFLKSLYRCNNFNLAEQYVYYDQFYHLNFYFFIVIKVLRYSVHIFSHFFLGCRAIIAVLVAIA